MIGLITSAAAAVAAWVAVNFLGKPILDIREKRLEALQIAERYLGVGLSSSDKLRETALKSLHDVGNTLLAYSRERSPATQLWCWVFDYDLELAARCLFGLAEGPRGEYRLDEDAQKNTLNALYISLGAARHLSQTEIEVVKGEIKKSKAFRRTRALISARRHLKSHLCLAPPSIPPSISGRCRSEQSTARSGLRLKPATRV